MLFSSKKALLLNFFDQLTESVTYVEGDKNPKLTEIRTYVNHHVSGYYICTYINTEIALRPTSLPRSPSATFVVYKFVLRFSLKSPQDFLYMSSI
jgi:hypothetical protein